MLIDYRIEEGISYGSKWYHYKFYIVKSSSVQLGVGAIIFLTFYQ